MCPAFRMTVAIRDRAYPAPLWTRVHTIRRGALSGTGIGLRRGSRREEAEKGRNGTGIAITKGAVKLSLPGKTAKTESFDAYLGAWLNLDRLLCFFFQRVERAQRRGTSCRSSRDDTRCVERAPSRRECAQYTPSRFFT